MKSLTHLVILAMMITSGITAQENTHFTNPLIFDILKGNYDPADYLPAFPVDDPYAISEDLINRIDRKSVV